MSEKIVKTDSVAEMKARARELLKCLRCAGSGNVMHYGNNYGRCIKCDGRGYDEELAVKVAAFAAKEVERATAKLVCSSCEAFKLHRLPTRDMLRERAEKAEQALLLATEAERLSVDLLNQARKEFGDSRHCTAKEAIDFLERKLAAPIWERAHGKRRKEWLIAFMTTLGMK